MAKDDRNKKAFCTHKGLFWFQLMLFRLCNAPSTFVLWRRLMDTVMEGLLSNGYLVYLDDIIIFSHTFGPCQDRLETERLRGAGLHFKPSKCQLFQREVAFLVYVVSGEGIATDPDKIVAVEKWPAPRNVEEVCSFHGFSSYYHTFIPGLTTICHPLVQLTRKRVKFSWSGECQTAFEQFKDLLKMSPMLAPGTGQQTT